MQLKALRSTYLQIEKITEVGVSPIDRLNASTPSGENSSGEVAIQHGPGRGKLPGGSSTRRLDEGSP